jgi:hypothetical protein
MRKDLGTCPVCFAFNILYNHFCLISLSYLCLPFYSSLLLHFLVLHFIFQKNIFPNFLSYLILFSASLSSPTVILVFYFSSSVHLRVLPCTVSLTLPYLSFPFQLSHANLTRTFILLCILPRQHLLYSTTPPQPLLFLSLPAIDSTQKMSEKSSNAKKRF